MNYDALRHFADSYGLIFLGLLYLVLCGWAFRPGGRERSREAAHSILKDSENG